MTPSSLIYTNQPVTAIRVRPNYTEIDYLVNGVKQTRRCDYVLCTIPFSVLRKIELEGFDARKIDSINNTVYCPATKVAFHTKSNFWAEQGIRGGASFSGAGVRQTYYPSVKFNPELGSSQLNLIPFAALIDYLFTLMVLATLQELTSSELNLRV